MKKEYPKPKPGYEIIFRQSITVNGKKIFSKGKPFPIEVPIK